MESKYGEEKGDEKEAKSSAEMYMEGLVQFMNSTDYILKVQDFMKANCGGFETYSDRIKSGEGNKLEWIDIYKDYYTLVEGELHRYCESTDMDPGSIFRIIEDYLHRNEQDEEFIPLFLKITNETHFFEQMCACAQEESRESLALNALAGECKGEMSMSSVWYLEPRSVDADELGNWLTVLGVPWPFRKLFMKAHKKPMKAVVIHDPRRKFELSISIPFFGTWSIDVELNGDWCEGSDRIGRKLKVKGVEDCNGDISLMIVDKAGCLMLVFLSMTSSTSLRMQREFFYSGVDTGSPDATLVVQFSQ